ncbi:hypothetical protein, partial [Rhodopseudomonas sp. AAP120]|uniref:hypothetical protein n=1 Tax=Rhodopseudomonas sp. AAP120 TaxID=1523430 RepID=UPI001AEBD393
AAGASGTRRSARPLPKEGDRNAANLGRDAPREREGVVDLIARLFAYTRDAACSRELAVSMTWLFDN